MSLKHYRCTGLDGSVQYRSVPEDALPPRWEKGAPRPVRVPRLPEDFEDWDAEGGAFRLDRAAKADRDAGPEAIASAHAQKAVEALLMMAGVAVEGMIAAEARALGLSPEDLAKAICEKHRAAIDAEVARRMMKAGNDTQDDEERKDNG